MSDLGASKVIVVEEEPALRGIPSASTSVAGAVGVAERGPIGQAVRVGSFEEYQQRFGGFTRDSELALAAMGYFDNGGRDLWVVRTVHYTDIEDAGTVTARRASAVLETAGTPQPGLRVEARDEGAHGNRLQVQVRVATSAGAPAFDLLVLEGGRVRETFPDVVLDPAAERHVARVVNATRSGSSRVRVISVDVPATATLAPHVAALTGGDSGLTGLVDRDFIGSATARTGLHALDRVQDLSTVIVPGRATPAVHRALVDYAERHRGGTVFAVLDPPAGASADAMVEYVDETSLLGGSTEFAAIYWPRVKVANPAPAVLGTAELVVAPPSGAIAGVFARTDAARVGGVYDPPAGIERGQLRGVLAFETDDVLDERQRDRVYPRRINPLTTGPGMPRYIDGSRTLKADGNFPYVAERRGTIFIEKSLRAGLEFARHRNHTEGLRAEVRRTIFSFLVTQMQNGAFRSQVAEKAFFVDMSMNGPAEVLSGKLVVRVGLATSRPAEFIVVRISQNIEPADGSGATD